MENGTKRVLLDCAFKFFNRRQTRFGVLFGKLQVFRLQLPQKVNDFFLNEHAFFADGVANRFTEVRVERLLIHSQPGLFLKFTQRGLSRAFTRFGLAFGRAPCAVLSHW